MTDLPNIRELLLRDGDIDLDDLGGTSDPSTMSRFAAHSAVINPAVSGVQTFPHFGTVDVTDTNGDIEIDGGDDTAVLINTAGVYAVLFNWDAFVVGATGLKTLDVQMSGSTEMSASTYKDGLNVIEWGDLVAVTSYFAAASQVKLSVNVTTTDADTWGLSSVVVGVQRLV